jgi:hypothetical protein
MSWIYRELQTCEHPKNQEPNEEMYTQIEQEIFKGRGTNDQ